MSRNYLVLKQASFIDKRLSHCGIWVWTFFQTFRFQNSLKSFRCRRAEESYILPSAYSEFEIAMLKVQCHFRESNQMSEAAKAPPNTNG